MRDILYPRLALYFLALVLILTGCSPAPKVTLPPPPAETVTAKVAVPVRSEEHTSELQSLMRISYAVFCLKKKSTIYFYSFSLETYTSLYFIIIFYFFYFYFFFTY